MSKIRVTFSQKGAALPPLRSSSGPDPTASQGREFQPFNEKFGRADRAAIERLKKTGRELSEIIEAYLRLDKDEVLTRSELMRRPTPKPSPR
jgi:hypothetical protein